MSKPCMNKLAYRCWAAAFCILGTSISANAECASTPGNSPVEVRLSAFVFDGTVRSVNHVHPIDGTLTRVDDANLDAPSNPEGWRNPLIYVATMDVHRVWKGDVSPQFKVYFVWNVNEPSCEPGPPTNRVCTSRNRRIAKVARGRPSLAPPRCLGGARAQVLQATRRRSETARSGT